MHSRTARWGLANETSEPEVVISTNRRDDSLLNKMQSALGFRISLELHSTQPHSCLFKPATRLFKNSVPLAPGWYMMEVSGDQQSIGSLITLEAQAMCHELDSDQSMLAGTQRIEIGTSGISRRIIRINGACNRVVLTCHANTHANSDALQNLKIDLIRLSGKFARDRIKRSLEKWLANHHDAMTSQELYTLYQQYCPAPGIAQSYATWNDTPLIARNNTLDITEAQSRWQEKLTVIRIEANVSDRQHASITTPLVLLMDESVRLTTAFLDLLRDVDETMPNARIWYSDHGHIDARQLPCLPCFKPAWNPGLLLQGNYVGAMLLCRTPFFEQVGGVKAQAGQSAIYDFLLRASRHLCENTVVRVPRMLYQLPASHYQHPHGFHIAHNDKHALEHHLLTQTDRTPQIVEGPYVNTFCVHHALDTNVPSVEIIIPSSDHVHLLKRCIDTLLAVTDYPAYRIRVMDNNSCETATGLYYQSLSAHPVIQIAHYEGAFNYAAINNQAVEQSTADVILLLNNDTEIVQHDWLRRMVSEAWLPDVACVGARLLYPNGLIQHAGLIVGMQGIAGHVNRFALPADDGYAGSIRFSADYSALTAACLAVKRSVFTDMGGFDEQNLPIAYNDVDLCLRAREAGYRNRYLADVALVHHESVSRGNDDSKEKRARFNKEKQFMITRHTQFIDDDPAWNPNFLRSFTVPSLPAGSHDEQPTHSQHQGQAA